MSALTWEEPRAGRPGRPIRSRLITDDVLSELRANPQRWARVHDDVSHSTASAINSGRAKWALGFEARRPQVNGSKRSPLWMRYVGEAQS